MSFLQMSLAASVMILVILLPRQNLLLPQETLDCILTHEYVHILSLIHI